ncbi:MAG: hypothetical protein AABX29_05740 [Nanoarchaeota archaeon]
MPTIFFRMTDVPKIEERNTCLFNPKLPNLIAEGIVDDIVAMLSRYPHDYYAIIFKNAPKLELDFLVESLELRISRIKKNEVIKLSKYDYKQYDIGKIKELSPVRIDVGDYTHENLLKSLNLIRKRDGNCFYIGIDEKNSFKIPLGLKFGYYHIDVGYFLENHSLS